MMRSVCATASATNWVISSRASSGGVRFLKGVCLSGIGKFGLNLGNLVSQYHGGHLIVVGGYEDGRFLPNNNSTRAEACVMLVRLLNLKGLDTDVPQNNSDTTTTTTPTTDQNACQLTLQNLKSPLFCFGTAEISCFAA